MVRDVVVRRLGPRPLYLGNRRAADPASQAFPRAFDHVLTLSFGREPSTTHHHPLADGPGNPTQTFDAAVDTARALHRRDGELLVHCAAGVSRSVTVLATTIAVEEGTSFRRGLDVVAHHRRRSYPHPALREQGRRYRREAVVERDLEPTDPGARSGDGDRITTPVSSGSETPARLRRLLERLLRS